MDPSLTNWGLAFAQYRFDTDKLSLKHLALIQTQKSQLKQQRVNYDDLQRARHLARHAFTAVKKADIVFVELPIGSQSARAMTSYGVAMGILGSLQAQEHIIIGVLPSEIKLATIGCKKAPKQAIIERAIKKWPDLNWPRQTVKKTSRIVTSKCEHMADAIGAIEAGILTLDFQQLIALHKKAS